MALFREGDHTEAARKAILVEQREQLVKRMAQMQESLDLLDHKIENYERGIVQVERQMKR